MTDPKNRTDEDVEQGPEPDERHDTTDVQSSTASNSVDPADEVSTSLEAEPGEPDSETNPDAEPKPKKSGTKTVIIAVVALLVGIVIAGYWSWTQLEALRAELVQVELKSAVQADALATQNQREGAMLAEQLGEQLTEAQTRAEVLAETVNALNLRLNEVEQARPQALVAAEVEYLVGLASNRLTIERDREGALLALDAALARLTDIGSPAYVSLVAAIVADRARLESAPVADPALVVGEISALLEIVDRIEVNAEKLTPDAETPDADTRTNRSWHGFLSAVQSNLMQFVTVDRAPGASAPTLIPDHYYYARENIRLSLQNARTAVLRGDHDNLHLSLLEARVWLERLPADAEAVVLLLAGIEDLSETDLTVEYPHLNASMAVARQISVHRTAAQPSSSQDPSTSSSSSPDAAASDAMSEAGSSNAPDTDDAPGKGAATDIDVPDSAGDTAGSAAMPSTQEAIQAPESAGAVEVLEAIEELEHAVDGEAAAALEEHGEAASSETQQ